VVNVLLECKCYGMNPDCVRCEGFEAIEVTQTSRVPWQFDFKTLKFKAIGGLFQVFIVGDEIIGAGNISYETKANCFYIYELQSFWGEEGHRLMIDTMLMQPGIQFIEGNYKWEDCLK